MLNITTVLAADWCIRDLRFKHDSCKGASVGAAGSLECLWPLVQGVASRDIKLENTLKDGTRPRPLLKICDFGYSKARDTEGAIFPICRLPLAFGALAFAAAVASLGPDMAEACAFHHIAVSVQHVTNHSAPKSGVGTPAYSAPEVYRTRQTYDGKVCPCA